MMSTPVEPLKSLRVAYVITGLGTGGAEAMLEKLLMALTPDVVPIVVSLSTMGDLGPRLLARGVTVHALGMNRRLPSPWALWKLVRHLRAFRPDVVHTWMYHADLIGGLAARIAGVRAVLWGIHQSNIDASVNRRSTLLVMHVCAILSRWLPSRIASVAVRAREVHVAAGYANDRMVVIPNGFDVMLFRPDPQARDSVRLEFGLKPDARLIGMVGRYDPQKNHRGFCEAMAVLHARCSDVHAVLAGAQVDSGNDVLVGWLDEFSIAGVCHLLGKREDMPRLMAALDVLVMPSLGEAFPMVLGEAMACGVPCVVTDVGDSAAIVGAHGRVVAPGAMGALSEAIIELLALPPDERSALAVRAREHIRRHFDIHSVARQYENEYRSLVCAT